VLLSLVAFEFLTLPFDELSILEILGTSMVCSYGLSLCAKERVSFDAGELS